MHSNYCTSLRGYHLAKMGACILNDFNLGFSDLPTNDSEFLFYLWLIFMNPSLNYSHEKEKSLFGLKRFNKALHIYTLVVIFYRKGS